MALLRGGEVIYAHALKDGKIVSVGRYREAVSDGVKYAVIVKGDADIFGSPLTAAVHFMALTGWGVAVELEALPVLAQVSAPWPMR